MTALYTIILWSLCTLGLIVAGYGLYRQQYLEKRLMTAEAEMQALRRMVLEKQARQQQWRMRSDPDKLLARETREAVECACPAGK